MAITPTRPAAPAGIEVVLWEALTTSESTGVAVQPSAQAPLAGAVQVFGTFGSATITLEGSIDGTNYVTLKDMTGSDVSLTAAGLVEFSTSVRYLRPKSAGGSSDDVDVYLILRG